MQEERKSVKQAENSNTLAIQRSQGPLILP